MNLFNRAIDLGGGSKLALNWRVLGLLNLYRVLVPLVLLGLYSLGGSRGIAVDDPTAVLRRHGLLSVFRLVQRRFGAQTPGDPAFSDHSAGQRRHRELDVAAACLRRHCERLGAVAAGSGGRPGVLAAAAQRAVPGGRRRPRGARRHDLAAADRPHRHHGVRDRRLSGGGVVHLRRHPRAWSRAACTRARI